MGAGAQLPLAMVGEGDTATVEQVKGNAELKQHLAELGFVAGADVRVMSRAGGDVVVDVKGARLGLNRTMAMRITTR